jgi:hypothetical protein
VPGATSDHLEVENVVKPGARPIMHVHHYQEEAVTVEQGQAAPSASQTVSTPSRTKS